MFLKKFSDKSTFFCFTPGVMLATFIIEIILAIYVFVRYRMSAFGRLVALTILVLASFQLAEYQVCAGSSPLLWSRIGFALITLLPVLGLHLISHITHKKHFLKWGYVLALAYIAIFIFTPKAIIGAVCGGNYIIFQTAQELSWLYNAYYFGLLLLGFWEILRHGDTGTKRVRQWMLIGYLAFLVPTGIVYIIDAQARSAIPSIMCGFALLLAFILAFRVVSIYHGDKK